MLAYSGTQIDDPEVRDEDSGQPWDNDRASWSSGLSWIRIRTSRVKGKSLTARPPLSLNPFATGDAYMRQLFHCLQWYACSEIVKLGLVICLMYEVPPYIP